MTFTPQKKKKNTSKSRRFFIYVAIAGLCILVILGVYFFLLGIATNEFRFDYTVEYIGEPARPHIETYLQTTLVESADNLHFFYTAWKTAETRLRLDVDIDQVQDFLDSLHNTCLTNNPQAGSLGYSVAGDLDWWIKSTERSFLGADCGDNPHWMMVVDNSRSDYWRFYIESFTL